MNEGIGPGDLVTATDAEGEELPRRAISGVTESGPNRGGRFPVIWVCREEEWHAAQREGRYPDGIPWPAEDVRPRSGADRGGEA